MSAQQPNAWQTAGRPRNSNSASRTPQNRSCTQSPIQQTAVTQSPRQEGGRGQQQQSAPTSNARPSRHPSNNTNNGASRAETAEEPYKPLNGFNAEEVKEFLGRDVGSVATYTPAEASGPAARSSGGAWGHKANHMANNQPFLVHLARQITTLESGG